ncbi:ABC transporter permease [Microvirga massiliensis]|uniref:ABC transporter permease n=1 Tax=Microvirga massiliensis TaxID=1033741 RepID=UPI00062BB409|nr:ABC transporter permease [Microvirga massiliensis]
MRPSDFVLYTVTAIVLVLILGPLAIVVLTSFSASDYFQFPPPGLSLRWFQEFFSLPNMRGAFILSLELALGASTAAIILGVLAALFVARQRGQASGLLQSLFMAPLVFPTIILGLALLLCYRIVGMPLLPGLVLAHILVGLPYCFRATLASLQNFDPTLEEAGQSLGASPLQTFFRITLPLIWPGVLSGWLFAFIVSFGELNTALFLTGPGVTTLPIEIFSYLQFEGSQLVIAAASTLQVGMILLVVLVMERAVGLARIVRS